MCTPPAPVPSLPLLPPPDFKQETLGVTFFDLSRFAEWCSSDQDERVAAFLQAFYVLSSERVTAAGGRIVKFIGDAGLAVFAPDVAEDVILVLCRLSDEVRALARGVSLDTHLNINVHVGSVVTGSFGPPEDARFDVLGKAVNVAARLGRRGVTLSPQAFRCLSPEGRARFDKITAPVTYRFSG